MTYFTHILFALAVSVSPALAEDMPEHMPDDVRMALTAQVANFGQQFNDGNMAAIFDYMPAKVIESLSTQSGLSQQDLFAAMQAEIDSAMAQVTIDDFGMDIDNASWKMTPDGRTGYALIPTFTHMTVEGVGKVNATGETLAFQEGDAWYLVRIDYAAQARMLTAAYPTFDGITFKPGAMVVVSE